MDIPLLKDEQVLPDKEVLSNALGNNYPVYEELMETIAYPKFDLVPLWNYYKDGKAWLCKVCYKKKTVFWLSVWDGFFKIAFYFTEKNASGIFKLDIDENIKEDFRKNKTIGKLMSLVIIIDKKEKLKDLLKIIEYKRNLK